jgi:hypothetical protein
LPSGEVTDAGRDAEVTSPGEGDSSEGESCEDGGAEEGGLKADHLVTGGPGEGVACVADEAAAYATDEDGAGPSVAGSSVACEGVTDSTVSCEGGAGSSVVDEGVAGEGVSGSASGPSVSAASCGVSGSGSSVARQMGHSWGTAYLRAVSA